MTFIGTDQDTNIDHILERARFFLDEGRLIQIKRQTFSGTLTKEHPNRFEYELYVDFGDD